MKRECRSCKFFGPECFGGYARCQLLQVVQTTGVLMVLDESHPDISGVKHLSVHVTFGCVLWEESKVEAEECGMLSQIVHSGSGGVTVEDYTISRALDHPEQLAVLELHLLCSSMRIAVCVDITQADALQLMHSRDVLVNAVDRLGDGKEV